MSNPRLCPTCMKNELDVLGKDTLISRIDDKTTVCFTCGAEEYYSLTEAPRKEFTRKERYVLAYGAIKDVVEDENLTYKQRLRRLETLRDNLDRLRLFDKQWIETQYEKHWEDLVIKDSSDYGLKIAEESEKYPDEELDYEELERRLRYRLEKERQERG